MFKRNFQKKIAFFLFSLLLLAATGQWAVLLILRKNIKQEVKERIEYYYKNNTEALTKFSFSTQEANLLLQKEENEFEYQHVLYDIVSIRFEKDSVFIRAFADEKETEIAAKMQTTLRDFVANEINPNHQEQKTKLVFKNIFSKYLKMPPPSIYRHFGHFLANVNTKIAVAAASTLSSRAHGCEIPPPKSMLIFC